MSLARRISPRSAASLFLVLTLVACGIVVEGITPHKDPNERLLPCVAIEIPVVLSTTQEVTQDIWLSLPGDWYCIEYICHSENGALPASVKEASIELELGGERSSLVPGIANGGHDPFFDNAGNENTSMHTTGGRFTGEMTRLRITSPACPNAAFWKDRLSLYIQPIRDDYEEWLVESLKQEFEHGGHRIRGIFH